MCEDHPHSPAALGRGIDLLPFVAVLALPFAFAFWAMGVPGDAAGAEIEGSWWFRGYLAMLLYAPAMAFAWIGERLARRWKLPGVRIALGLLRWALFLVVFGPILLFAVAVYLPGLRAMWM